MKLLYALFLLFIAMSSQAGLFGPTESEVREALLSKWKISHGSINPRVYRIESGSVNARRLKSEKDTWIVEYVTNLEREGRIKWTAKVRGGNVSNGFIGSVVEETGVRVDLAGSVIDSTPIQWNSSRPVPDEIRKSELSLSKAWESFCGYYFARDYTQGMSDEDVTYAGEVEFALNPSYRHLTTIFLKHDDFVEYVENSKGGYRRREAGFGMCEARIEGQLPRDWTKERVEEECRVVATEMEKRFGVELTLVADCHYLFRSSKGGKSIVVMVSPSFKENASTRANRTMEVIVTNRDRLPQPKVPKPVIRRMGGSEVL